MLAEVFAAIDAGGLDKTRRTLDHFWARLAMHIRAEHLHLFPAVLAGAGSDVAEIVRGLHDDHDLFMRELAQAIKLIRTREMADAKILESVHAIAEDIRRRLALHDRIEEEQIYRLAGPGNSALWQSLEKEITNLPPRFRPSNVPPIEGFVLAGGASTRMGRDKANIRFGEETLARRAAGVIRAFSKSVRVVGATVDGLECVPDVSGAGEGGTRASLIGLHSALFHGRTEWIAVLACDLPFVTPELFGLLISSAACEVDAVVPVQPDGRHQPLAAVYRRSTCLEAVEESLLEGELRLGRILRKVRTLGVGPESYDDPGGRMFFNINTPADLAEAHRLIGGGR